MKNVLSIVSYQFLPAKMGGQKGIAFFNRFFSKQVNLTCVTTINNNANFADGYDLLTILSSSKIRYINLFFFFRIKKIIQQKGITHLLLEHPYYGWLGILIQRFCKVTFIVHAHNIESLRFKSTGKWWWRILAFYEKWTFKNADICFFINDEDKAYAITHFIIAPQKCITIPYGFELDRIPSAQEKLDAKNFLRMQYAIAADEKILLFNGTLNYKPNLDAIDVILEKINPILLKNPGFKYKLIICGKDLPRSYQELAAYKNRNIVYAGFVDDIIPYFKGADIFINPVIDGGGIKTKLVEALGYNLDVVTTAEGAAGVPINITGNKMSVIRQSNWESFAQKIINSGNAAGNIPAAFFEHFYWEEIAKKAAKIITNN